MIRKLKESDKDTVMDYVSEEPSINLFIIGDIEQHGFDTDFQEVWGKFNADNNIDGVLLRYQNNFIVYVKDLETDLSGFKEMINSFDGKKMISGKSTIINNFKDSLQNYEERLTYFCELRDKSKLLSWDNNIKSATEEDAKKIYDIIDTIDEFSIKDSVEAIRDKLKNNSKVAYYIEDENEEIITVSQISAENSKSAMVVGVATRREYREKGYMSKCLSKLCYDYLVKNKILCLFYDNPKAGRVYHKLGFKEIGLWTMLVEK